MSTQTLPLDERLYKYLTDNSVREIPLLAKLRQTTGELEEARMQISPEQGQFMALVLKLMSAKKVIEIGTFTGYSSTVMALALPQDGYLLACDDSQHWTDMAREVWQQAGVSHKIELQLGQAKATLDRLVQQQDQLATYDFAFIDADKVSYRDYYERLLQLVRPGGLIAFDNTLWGGRVADPENREEDTLAIRELNEQLLQDQRIDLSLVPIGDGLSLCRKREKTHEAHTV